MSEPPVPEFDDATLRRALREAPGRAPDSDLTSEQLRAAAAGELPPDEMQTVLDAANRDPALRLGLALAFELESDASAATTAPEPRRIRDTIAVALPIAACLALVWLVWPRPEPTISDGLG
ncbi:MAG: hypothetical protein JKY37_10625, partial [Nannocystaceae bacterium]|nr:hypothetical protein [Nannocystaceae bacterium]